MSIDIRPQRDGVDTASHRSNARWEQQSVF